MSSRNRLAPVRITLRNPVLARQQLTGELAELGLVKIDILGLRNLTVIAATARAVEVRPDAIPPDDPKTYALLAAGETLGVFQLDSPGIRNLLRQLRPENIDDLIAALSLYRPGPFAAGVVETFTRRRRGREQALTPYCSEERNL